MELDPRVPGGNWLIWNPALAAHPQCGSLGLARGLLATYTATGANSTGIIVYFSYFESLEPLLVLKEHLAI